MVVLVVQVRGVEDDFMSRKFFVVLISLFVVGILENVYSQNDADLFLYSKQYHGGSARFEAMGGAFGSLGADISAGQINPASFGRFSTSQVSVSLGSPINSTQSNFDSTGNAAKASSVGFTIPSFGVVFTKDLSLKNNGDMYSQFAFGINRLSNYKQNMVIEGV